MIDAKLHGGKSPEILEAITFSPKEPQTGLRAISIAGNPNYRVDPVKDDFFKRLIDLRTAIKAELKAIKKRLKAVRKELEIASGAEADALRSEEQALSAQADALDSDQQALKILANSTSYGIFVEFIVAASGRSGKAHLLRPEWRGISRRVEKGRGAGAIFSSIAGDPDNRRSAAHARHCRTPLH